MYVCVYTHTHTHTHTHPHTIPQCNTELSNRSCTYSEVDFVNLIFQIGKKGRECFRNFLKFTKEAFVGALTQIKDDMVLVINYYFFYYYFS
jgi:hypothetical protein